jgi:Subtilase family
MDAPFSNAAEWSRRSEPASFDGYVAWEAAHLPDPPENSDWYVPVFAQFRKIESGPVSLLAAMKAALAVDSVLIAQDERDFLATEIMLAPVGWPYPVRLVAFAKADSLPDLPAYLLVLHVGAPVLLRHSVLAGRPKATAMALEPIATVGSVETPPKTTIAVIDDGIAYLNARFRAGPGTTRIQRIWLQASEIMDPADVVCGRTLSAKDIDELLAGAEPEAEIYRAYNRTLRTDHERQSTNHMASHGTHVLDIAAGASIDCPADQHIRDMPILAVQLPPAALRDTSGRRLEGYVVQGLRWLIAQNLRKTDGGTVAPMVVNLSLGSLAGPGNDTSFLAEWFQFEMQRYARLASGGVLRVVAAYGNARRARLVARSELRAQRAMALDWCLLPDDHTPSFVEMRVDRQVALSMRTRVVPPDPRIPPLDISWPEPGECWTYGDPVIAMVTGVAERGQRMVHIAVAPTAGIAAAAPPGRWKLILHSKDDAPAQVSIKVQRDDTPAGYRTLGRQSWLDHEHGWDWDVETHDWTAPCTATTPTSCPITREGTSVSYSGTSSSAVLLVSAVRPVTGQPGDWVAALYSASGVTSLSSPGESTGPTLAAPGDDGVVLKGRRASGVLSGSTVRLSGTSVAAPAVSRALAIHLGQSSGATDPASELAGLLGSAPGVERHPLTGYGSLNPASART